MPYFIDEKEVKEDKYIEQIRSQLLITISNNIGEYLDKEQKHLYEKLTPFEQTQAVNMIAKEQLKKHLELTEFELLLFRFKKE